MNSKNEHGVHSPFVFDLVTNCFYDKTKFPEYRNSLLANKNTIEITDFGAGSRVFKSNTREISKIAKTAGISSKNAELLFRIVNYFQPNSILEIGTSLGLATSVLSLGSKNSKIISLEGCPSTMAVAEKMFQVSSFKLPKNTIQFVNTEFSTYLKNFQLQSSNFQLIYFDGNHSLKEMENAWEIIKKHPKVKVTIDTFQWGIVFFRTEQEKEHFIINPSKNWSSHLFERIKI